MLQRVFRKELWFQLALRNTPKGQNDMSNSREDICSSKNMILVEDGSYQVWSWALAILSPLVKPIVYVFLGVCVYVCVCVRPVSAGVEDRGKY